METDKKAIPVFMRVICLALAAITLVCTVLFFIGDNWIPIAVMYGSVAVLGLLGALDSIIYRKDKFTGVIFIFLALGFCFNLIVILVRNVNV